MAMNEESVMIKISVEDILVPAIVGTRIYKIWQFWFWMVITLGVGFSISWISFGLWCWKHTLNFKGALS